jgi:hypothetical protein
MVTRAEYLAGSLSRQQPWADQGISRRPRERRRRKLTSVTKALDVNPPRVTSAPAKGARALFRSDRTASVESPARKSPRTAVGPADAESPVPAHKRTLLRQAEELLISRIHAYWDTHGIRHSDPEALTKAIHTIELPKRFKTHGSPGVAQSLPTVEGAPPSGIRRLGRFDRKMGQIIQSSKGARPG